MVDGGFSGGVGRMVVRETERRGEKLGRQGG